MTKLFEVGGCVRDSLLGVDSKDIDFAVEAESFDVMREFLQEEGFKIFLETPQYLTIRAMFPVDHASHGKKAADFVLCRKDGEYADGRRPDSVTPGSLLDDLERRDFTVNAIARDLDGRIIDPFGGQEDLKRNLLRCVGSTRDRFTEDALRALRALRFHITRGFVLHEDIRLALHSGWLPPLVAKVSTERRKDELFKCFFHDVDKTLFKLAALPDELREAIWTGGLWLEPTMKASKNA